MRHLVASLSLTCMALAQNVNLALAGTANQSATIFNGAPARAIDGIRDGIWQHNSVTHTPDQPGNFFEVLIAPNLVNEVVIYNRADCCGARLANFRVEASISGVQLWSRDFFAAGGAVPQGRALRIALPPGGLPIDTLRLTQLGPAATGEQILSLAEVELIQYGAQAEVDLAPLGIATQTNGSYATTGREAIDGSVDGFFNNGSVTHTQNGPGNRWRVDLPFRSDVHEVRIWNRTDCCGGRLSNFRLSVFDGSTEVFGQDLYTAGGSVPTTGPELVALPANTVGTAVQVALLGVGSTGEQILSLAEVEVIRYGLPPSYTPYGAGCAGSAGTPQLQALATSLPALGTTFSLQVTNLPVPGLTFLAFGLSASSWNGTALPLALAGVGAPGCFVHASPDGSLVLLANAGTAALAIAIPSDRVLLGTVFYHQALVLDRAANALGATVSNAARLVIGL